MIGIGINIAADFLRITSQQGGEEPPAFDIDVQAWLDLITDQPSATQNDYVNTMIKDMKSGLGVERMMNWSDTFYHLAAETAEASLKNMVKNAHHAVAVNGPVFTPLEGWQGDGVSAYIDTNYNAYSDADNHKLNSAATGVYIRKPPTATLQYEIYARRSNAVTIMRIMTSESVTRFNVNSASIGINISTRYGAELGLYVINRVESTGADISRNKESFMAITSDSTEIPNTNFLILGTGGAYSHGGQMSLFFTSKGITENERNVIYDPFQELMTKNGKEV